MNFKMSLKINNITTIDTNSSGYWSLPTGTTNQRPTLPVIGMIRYNTDLSHIEIYTRFGWKSLKYSIGGDEAFITPGTYTWTVPEEVYTICGVCVGGGGSGGVGPNASGGGGGGLHWRNNIAVTPGQQLTVVVGGISGESYVQYTDTYLIRATGGSRGSGSQNVGSNGGGWTNLGSGNEGGGTGGSGGGIANGGSTGGGGAAGYSGNGGSSYYLPNGGIISATAGNGGGGGGGVGSQAQNISAAPGGGVGIFGEGLSGGIGQPGSNGSGGRYGGGGGGYRTTGAIYYDDRSPGYSGAVRIIWGKNRNFPFNAQPI